MEAIHSIRIDHDFVVRLNAQQSVVVGPVVQAAKCQSVRYVVRRLRMKHRDNMCCVDKLQVAIAHTALEVERLKNSGTKLGITKNSHRFYKIVSTSHGVFVLRRVDEFSLVFDGSVGKFRNRSCVLLRVVKRTSVLNVPKQGAGVHGNHHFFTLRRRSQLAGDSHTMGCIQRSGVNLQAWRLARQCRMTASIPKRIDAKLLAPTAKQCPDPRLQRHAADVRHLDSTFVFRSNSRWSPAAGNCPEKENAIRRRSPGENPQISRPLAVPFSRSYDSRASPFQGLNETVRK